MSKNETGTTWSSVYKIFFLYIEPFTTILGAYYAHFRADEYIRLSSHLLPSLPIAREVPLVTQIVFSQLANLYLFLAITEASILRTTKDVKVWRTMLIALLIADFGHLYTYKPLGHEVYYRVDKWNEMDWGGVGFVYLAAVLRIAFLNGVGHKTGSLEMGKLT